MDLNSLMKQHLHNKTYSDANTYLHHKFLTKRQS
jgi:hypothetical protein